ncbi:expansin-like B1 [Olea europaea subsp. europaea]|uniref:Expansin-like B1 n=1 Tax=Olea europaea subsp. europaea TaxID=158383 RepID=A0A8S0R3W0_OLEEU|nr:expansin-like B1 [Olea europaea subsp. europaea]
MACYSLFFSLILLLAAVCYGQDAFVCSRATYYGSPDCLGTATGACGFGEYGKTVYNGEVTGVSRLYRNGAGCGACYQVRCNIPTHCSEEGTQVVVTDYGEGDRTDFILSTRGYAKLAQPGMAAELFSYGVVDIEYRRIPCHYRHNLLLKIHESSRYPLYLAIVPLYKGGIYDITDMEIWQDDCKEWIPMRRAYGTVFDIPNPPRGPLIIRFRFVVEANAEVKWVQLASAVPSDWKAGIEYNTTFQLN